MPGVHLVGSGALGFDLTAPADCHVYLVVDPQTGEAALIDAGSGLATERILANVDEALVPRDHITTLLVTHAHADHAGGAADLAAAVPGVRVITSAVVALILANIGGCVVFGQL